MKLLLEKGSRQLLKTQVDMLLPHTNIDDCILFYCAWIFAGIDKLTEKSQVSEDGTMVSIPKTESPPTVQSDQSAVAGTSDTESNSGKDNEVSVCVSVCMCLFKQYAY